MTCKNCKKQCKNSFCSNRCSILYVASLNPKPQKHKGRRSKNEIMFCRLCKLKWSDTLSNEKMFDGLDADIVIPSLKVAVMWNGAWHYKKLFEAHDLESIQERDKRKQLSIKAAGYSCYIIKDMGGHDPEFVKKEFDKFMKKFNG